MKLNSIPEEIQKFCSLELGRLEGFQAASGGCINNGGKITTQKGCYFLKWNSASKFRNMFSVEAKGLSLLANPGCIKIPEVINIYEGREYSCLILEFIEAAAKDKNYWKNLAEGLACLHRQSSSSFGLDYDNYIGSLSQHNKHSDQWISFFIQERLHPQIKLAYDHHKIGDHDLQKFEYLKKALPNLLVEEKPSLIHGDLWCGNIMTDSSGQPVLIDPAVSFSHREMDLAFTQLFGGFDDEFYAVYQEVFPMEKDYRARLDIYTLYPLMVHVNLFGGGYYNQVRSILSKFTN